MKIYLDTSVISYLLQTDAPEKMEETGRLWEKLKEGRDFITIEKNKNIPETERDV